MARGARILMASMPDDGAGILVCFFVWEVLRRIDGYVLSSVRLGGLAIVATETLIDSTGSVFVVWLLDGSLESS